jgi:hypothetical protein
MWVNGFWYKLICSIALLKAEMWANGFEVHKQQVIRYACF